MTDQLQQFVAGRTRINEREDKQGNPVLEIQTSELTPFRAKAVDSLTGLSCLCALAASGYMILQTPTPQLEEMIFSLMIIIVSYPAGLKFWQSLLQQETTIIMSTEHIDFIEESRQLSLSRMQKHRFGMRPHDKALKERRDHEFEQRKAQQRGSVIYKKPYYGEGFHVVLVHLEQRHDLLEVHEKKNAHDVMAALKLCDNHLNNYLNIGNEGKQSKEDDWNDAPGGL